MPKRHQCREEVKLKKKKQTNLKCVEFIRKSCRLGAKIELQMDAHEAQNPQ